MAVAAAKAYEEARRERLEANRKHLQDLGISKISKNLLEIGKIEKSLKFSVSPRSQKKSRVAEVRRSTRKRNNVLSYSEAVDFSDFQLPRRRTRSEVSGKQYLGRIATYGQQVCAQERAEKLQENLQSKHPSFVKTMVRSHVSSCFWLGLPTRFCRDNLPKVEVTIILEDEEDAEYKVVYIPSRTGMSGGWRGFAMDHDLEDGDVLVFELIDTKRFKVYIIKACEEQLPGNMEDEIDLKSAAVGSNKKRKPTVRSCSLASQKSEKQTRSSRKAKKG